MFRRIPRLTFSSDNKSSRQMTMLSRDKIERLMQVMIPWPFVSNIIRPPRWLAQNIWISLALIQREQKQRLLLLILTMEEAAALRLPPMWIILRMASYDEFVNLIILPYLYLGVGSDRFWSCGDILLSWLWGTPFNDFFPKPTKTFMNTFLHTVLIRLH